MALRVCPSCSRHAREQACPFCGTAIPQVPAVTLPRVARSALILGAAAVVTACSTAQPAYGIAIPDAAADVSDAGTD